MTQTLAITSDPIPVASRIAYWMLQAAHRLGFVALLANLAAWVLLYKDSNIDGAIVIAAGAADLGLCCAMASKLLTRRFPARRREATSVVIFNLVIFVLSLTLMLVTRMPVLRQSGAEFFSPSTPVGH